MSFDFEALVGHLYIVGGRSISMMPPGAQVEVAPKKVARGRETETFFALVLPSGDVTAPTAFYEQMSRLATERYFNTTGSITAVLRTVFNGLNENLVEHNRSGRRQYEANMVCAVLRGNDLILARVGAGVAVVRLMGETKTFPENMSDDEALFGPPLGVQPIPDVKMTRYTVANGTRMLLSDSNLADIPGEKLTTGLISQDISEVLSALKELINKQITLLAIEFVPPEAPVQIPVKEGTSTVEIAAATKTATTEMKAVSVETPDQPTPRRERRKPLSETIGAAQIQLQQGAGAAALQTSRVMSLVDGTLARVFPLPKEGQRRRSSSPLMAGMVILIPVIVVILVLVFWLGRQGETEFEICLKELTSQAQVARGIASNNRTDTLNAWRFVLEQVDECNALRPGDALLGTFKNQAQTTIDGLNQTSRRETMTVSTIKGAAGLTQLVLQASDIYALDGKSQVYRIALAPDGRSATNTPQPIPVMRQGATIGGAVVDEIIGISFDESNNVVMAIDRSGLMITCQPRFITECNANRLLAAEKWVNPVAVEIWESRLFILDAGANQIWRYLPDSAGFGNPPTEYFQGQSRPALGTAVDFVIYDSGNGGAVFILRSDGVMSRYFNGAAQDFGLVNFPEPMTSSNALKISESPVGLGLLIVDRISRSVYETTLAGTWQYSYRVYNEDLFASITDAAYDSSQRLIYVVSGNAILAFAK